MENSVYYEHLAKKAIEKNIGYFMRKFAREGDLSTEKKKSNGVYFNPKLKTNPWRVQINCKYVGMFPTEELAVEARDKYLKKLERLKFRVA